MARVDNSGHLSDGLGEVTIQSAFSFVMQVEREAPGYGVSKVDDDSALWVMFSEPYCGLSNVKVGWPDLRATLAIGPMLEVGPVPGPPFIEAHVEKEGFFHATGEAELQMFL